MTLTEFLLARIAEDEEDSWVMSEGGGRMRDECEAKRRIVNMSTWISNQERRPTDRPGVYDVVDTVSINEDMEPALFALATIYADHPDYDESWRP